MGRMVAETGDYYESSVLCMALSDGQKEARKKQRTLGTAKNNLKYVLADSAPRTNSGYNVACRVGKPAVLNHAVSTHTNCRMTM